MNNPVIDIERLVREVLAELGAMSDAPTMPPPAVDARSETVSSSIAKEPTQEKSNANELVLTSRIVTMAEIAGRIAAIRRVVVSRGAIVTPAVRDELIRRGVTLDYADAAQQKAEKAAVRLALMTMGVDFEPASLTAALAREGLKVEHTALNCLIAATEQLAAETAKPDTLGLLLTRHVAAGLCLANRLHGVRAITGVDTPSVATAASAVGANVLVVDPAAGTFFQLKQMATEFCRGGVRPCPEVFAAQLS
jgi:hypothetical protein